MFPRSVVVISFREADLLPFPELLNFVRIFKRTKRSERRTNGKKKFKNARPRKKIEKISSAFVLYKRTWFTLQALHRPFEKTSC